MRILLLAIALLCLAGCLESEAPLFDETEAAPPVLGLTYVVTDGSSPIGRVVLTEREGRYTVAYGTDERASTRLEEGTSFQLFPADLTAHWIERIFGPMAYFWVQASRPDRSGYDYELIGIRQEAPRVVFRWGFWLLNENDTFTTALFELAGDAPEQLDCTSSENQTCYVRDRAVLARVTAIMIETELMPVRAYVPQ